MKRVSFIHRRLASDHSCDLVPFPQRHRPGLEVDLLRIQILAGEAGDADIRIPQRFEKLGL